MLYTGQNNNNDGLRRSGSNKNKNSRNGQVPASNKNKNEAWLITEQVTASTIGNKNNKPMDSHSALNFVISTPPQSPICSHFLFLSFRPYHRSCRCVQRGIPYYSCPRLDAMMRHF